jgi:hypothetical protein
MIEATQNRILAPRLVVSFESEIALQAWLDKEQYIVSGVWKDITVHKSNTRNPWQYSHDQVWFEEKEDNS